MTAAKKHVPIIKKRTAKFNRYGKPSFVPKHISHTNPAKKVGDREIITNVPNPITLDTRAMSTRPSSRHGGSLKVSTTELGGGLRDRLPCPRYDQPHQAEERVLAGWNGG